MFLIHVEQQSEKLTNDRNKWTLDTCVIPQSFTAKQIVPVSLSCSGHSSSIISRYAHRPLILPVTGYAVLGVPSVSSQICQEYKNVYYVFVCIRLFTLRNTKRDIKNDYQLHNLAFMAGHGHTDSFAHVQGHPFGEVALSHVVFCCRKEKKCIDWVLV